MPRNQSTSAASLRAARPRSVTSGVNSRSVRLFATLLLMFLASTAWAMPLRHTLEGLIEVSDMIVVARVDSVRGSHVIGKRWATAKVREVWKGPETKTIKFLASRRREPLPLLVTGCFDPDVTDAKRGELVLLFLTKEKKVGWVVLGKGRGRFPVITRTDKEYLADVPLNVSKVGIPEKDLKFSREVELSALRAFVVKTLQEKKPESSRPLPLEPGSVPERAPRAIDAIDDGQCGINQ
jgi:hypothetical protein